MFKKVVIPAQAGIQVSFSRSWIPVSRFREGKYHGNDTLGDWIGSLVKFLIQTRMVPPSILTNVSFFDNVLP